MKSCFFSSTLYTQNLITWYPTKPGTSKLRPFDVTGHFCKDLLQNENALMHQFQIDGVLKDQ